MPENNSFFWRKLVQLRGAVLRPNIRPVAQRGAAGGGKNLVVPV
jgi:hypothetical protein